MPARVIDYCLLPLLWLLLVLLLVTMPCLAAAPAINFTTADNTQLEEGLPAVWMVKLIDMANNGRRDMVNAIQRAGGYDAAAERLG